MLALSQQVWKTLSLSCASETWMETLLLQHHTPYQPLTEEPGLLKSCLDATLTQQLGGSEVFLHSQGLSISN